MMKKEEEEEGGGGGKLWKTFSLCEAKSFPLSHSSTILRVHKLKNNLEKNEKWRENNGDVSEITEKSSKGRKKFSVKK
jgi:hypothetical protein